MSEHYQTEKCANCKSDVLGNFCSNCGQPQELSRINGKYILSEIGSILNFDKGILFTIRELLLRPGSNIQKFIHDDRNRLVSPIVFIIVCSLIYTLCQQLFHFEDGYVNYAFSEGSTAGYIFGWVSKNYGYGNIIMAIFIGIWIKIFFRKSGYNFFEILILLCFVMGIGMLFFAILGTIESFVDFKIMGKGSILVILYIIWAIGQFFDKKKIANYIKAFFAYFIGYLTYAVLILVVGYLIDFIK